MLSGHRASAVFPHPESNAGAPRYLMGNVRAPRSRAGGGERGLAKKVRERASLLARNPLYLG